MEKVIDIKGGGLKPLPNDGRDFSLAGIFDQIDIKTVPSIDFVSALPLLVKDQGDTDFCSAYAITSASEDEEHVELLPEYQFFKTKQLSGDPEEWGADLRTACKVLSKFGSVPVNLARKYKGIPRSEVVDPKTWPAELDAIAAKYKKETFFKIDGKYDTFDNIRTALWQHQGEYRTIVCGAIWRHEWTHAPGGVIPKDKFEGGFGHAFKLFGQKMIDGEPYLKAQLSNGTDIGYHGIFFFPREVVNREFAPYGQFMFKDLPRQVVDCLQKSWVSNIISIIKQIFI